MLWFPAHEGWLACSRVLTKHDAIKKRPQGLLHSKFISALWIRYKYHKRRTPQEAYRRPLLCGGLLNLKPHLMQEYLSQPDWSRTINSWAQSCQLMGTKLSTHGWVGYRFQKSLWCHEGVKLTLHFEVLYESIYWTEKYETTSPHHDFFFSTYIKFLKKHTPISHMQISLF
jgi:hypothetical protein